MLKTAPLIAALLLASCAGEAPPAADPEAVLAAVDKAELEMNRASGPASKSPVEHAAR